MKERKIFTAKATALEAHSVGFFYKELPKKGTTCDHVVCGSDRNYKRGAKPLRCRRHRYRRYTAKELLSPDTRPEAAAVRIDVAEQKGHKRHEQIVLYDLLEDKWVSDEWWRLCAPYNELLTPMSDMGIKIIPPSEIHNINEVLGALKASP